MISWYNIIEYNNSIFNVVNYFLNSPFTNNRLIYYKFNKSSAVLVFLFIILPRSTEIYTNLCLYYKCIKKFKIFSSDTKYIIGSEKLEDPGQEIFFKVANKALYHVKHL